MAGKTVGIIPARYASTRFPGKALAVIGGKPMIQWVYERCQQARSLERVLVATDDERIRAAVVAFGGEAVMTREDHPNGTSRLAEVAERMPEVGVVVNVQGDEPLIEPESIEQALAPLLADEAVPMSTLRSEISDREEIENPNVVKVVVDRQGFALYFSRHAIPYEKLSTKGGGVYWKHIGLYVYRRDFLLTYAQLPPTDLEQRERLEQLRALEHGYRIACPETKFDSIGVDTPEDLERVQRVVRLGR